MNPTRENKRSVIGDAIYNLRFLAMSQNEFAQNVAASGLLTAEEMIPIYNKFNGVQSPDLKWTISKKRVNRTTSNPTTGPQMVYTLTASEVNSLRLFQEQERHNR